MKKEFYTKFPSFETELTNKEKSLKKDIKSFKEAISSNTNTSNTENRIKKNLESFKELVDQLHEAYKSRNAPSNIPSDILEKRQKEIDAFLASYNNMNVDFKKLIDGTYSYKDSIEEGYQNKNTEELIKITKDKLKEQDKKLDEIMHEAIIGKNEAKNLNAGIKDDNEKTKDINKKTDKVDSKIKKLTERFKNFFIKK